MFHIIRRLFTTNKIKFPIEKRNMTRYEEEFKPNLIKHQIFVVKYIYLK